MAACDSPSPMPAKREAVRKGGDLTGTLLGRRGVSEGQYTAKIFSELKIMKKACGVVGECTCRVR